MSTHSQGIKSMKPLPIQHPTAVEVIETIINSLIPYNRNHADCLSQMVSTLKDVAELYGQPELINQLKVTMR